MPENTKNNILDDLDELDKAIIKYKVEGYKSTEIAEKLEKSRQTIDKRFKKIRIT